MLEIMYKKDEAEHPQQEILPWLDFVTPELLLCKDGSLLAAYAYQGPDPDNLDDDLVDQAVTQLQRAFGQFDSRLTGWWIVDKRKDYTYPEGDFDNTTAAQLDRLIGNTFRSGISYRFRHWFFLLYTGHQGVEGYLDSVTRLMNEEGRSLPVALLRGALGSVSASTEVLRDRDRLQQAVGEFEGLLGMFDTTIPTMRFERLERRAFSNSLFHLANPATRLAPPAKPQGVLLDGWIANGYITTGKQVMAFQSEGDVRYCGVIGVKEWPSPTSPLLLEALMGSDVEMTICHIIRFLGKEQAKTELKGAMNYYRMTLFSPFNYVAQKMADATPEPDSGKQDLHDECKEAMRRLSSEGLGFAYHNLSIAVYADSEHELTTACQLVHGRLADVEFESVRERQNLGPSWEAMLPGQWARQSRYHLVSLENVADASPIFTMDEGNREHPYFSEVLRRPVSALAQFIDGYGGRYHFIPHVGQVGHAVLIAPTGGGKTTFVSLCLSQFRRYYDPEIGQSNVYIFDRDNSCRITTELHGGQHIDMKHGQMRLNPLAVLRDGSPDGQLWAREWIIQRIMEGGYRCTAEDRDAIDSAIQRLAMSTQDIRLSTLALQLPRHLTTELGEWLEDRPYGMFDSSTDDYSLSSWTCTEMKDLLAVDRLARAFIDYAFRKIYEALDGRPTFIYLEEASFLVNHPAFAARLDDWLKTFRKKNAFLWLTIQSPTSITSSDISATMTDNILTKILLANKSAEAHREAYIKCFGLTNENVDIVKTLMPQREYLILSNGFARVIRTALDSKSLAFLRSEGHLQRRFDEHKRSGKPNWKANYLVETASS
ncbi:VirB4 family type IV secretion system protein [Cupriavidus basilensis]|uniref:VirB4 family type IV secretion system protein n=1 Tax=Cupriavidus basilensis TaxID=68895 RepID=UPI0020A67772|nr:conjugal transfer protein TraC [Cupriavidus basilensis]MCP3023781.1 conjugal transfer protein TraC [Cupriavidus basilensis]